MRRAKSSAGARCAAGLLALFILVAAAGCAVIAVGAGAGAGVAAHRLGRVERVVDAEPAAVERAVEEALRAHGVAVTERRATADGAWIEGRRPDGTAVVVDIARRGPQRTAVGVRTGALGVSETEASERLLARIAERLGAAASRERGGGRDPASRSGAAPGRAARPPEAVVCFAAGSNALDADASATLDRLAATLRQRPEAKLHLRGHADADADAPPELGRLLAEGRAGAVKMHLVGKGVSPESVTTAPGSLPERGAAGAPPAAGCVEIFLDGR